MAMRSFITCTPLQILLKCTSQENDMGRACSMLGSEEECIWGLYREPEGRRSLGRLEVDGRIMLK
jgi:hypothetical protein